MALLIEAGQMTASDYVPTCPNLLLASEGASTDAIPHLSATDKSLNRPQGSAFEADTDVFEGTLCRFHVVAEPFAECAISGRAGLLYQSP
ncbi:hypothetical protein [Novosphingobium sp. ZW T3_23]|uniref:hypothetical protein n=1 Tax=Novosphingobium sp. ZW T3_23 TaxID=3378084 RepID=UPI003854B92A